MILGSTLQSSPDEGVFSGAEDASIVSSNKSYEEKPTILSKNIYRPDSQMSTSSSLLNSTFSSTSMYSPHEERAGKIMREEREQRNERETEKKEEKEMPKNGGKNWSDLLDHLKKEIVS